MLILCFLDCPQCHLYVQIFMVSLICTLHREVSVSDLVTKGYRVLDRGVGRGFMPGLERAIDEAGDV